MKHYTISSFEGKMILFATILASGMAFLDGSVVNIAVPVMQTTMQATLADVEWVINAYTLMLSSLILVSGSLGDAFGRKRIFIYGIAVFVFSSFLCSIARSIHLLILFRGLQGIGGAMMVPGSLSIITASFDSSHRGRAIGMWSGFAGGVAALGPFVGGWLVQTFGWPAIFSINIPLGFLAFAISLIFVPESENKKSKRIDILGTILLLVSLLGICYGLISGSGKGWTNLYILFSLLSGVSAFGLFIFTELKEKSPLVPLSLFRSSLVTGANLSTIFLYFALSGVIFFSCLIFNKFRDMVHYSLVWHYYPLFFS